ncbi:MAG: signal recognition particle protein Srp54 [Nanobdellota archaeon]
MVLSKLGSSLKTSLQKITQAVFVDEKLVNELVRDLQKALLQADVNVQLVFKLSEKIKKRILKEEVPAGLTKQEYLVNVVYEELVEFLGGEGYKIDFNKKPLKIMLVGLFGNGKTTTAGKMAKFFSKRGNKVAVVQTDTWRPAAYDQLSQLAEQINVQFYGVQDEKGDPVKIYQKHEKDFEKFDVVIIDTAGRDALSDDLVEELDRLNKVVIPDETLLVMSADIGQSAEKQAKMFNQASKVTGVVITKLDGTAKGGGALSACSVTETPVKFIGTGEKINDLEAFNPKGFVGRLLGWGDIEALLDKAKDAISNENAEDMGKKFLKGDFNLIDLYEQMQSMKKMGSLSKLVDLIPGMGQLELPKEALDVQEGKLKTWKFVMDSCTKEELEQPELINRDRIERIASGSGRNNSDVRELLKQYKQSKKMMKMFKGKGKGDMQKMMKKMGGNPGDLKKMGLK